jgi:hypothetical protein
LADNERIIGPAKLIHECGGDSAPLEITAAAALLYDNPADTAWKEIKDMLGTDGILSEVCALEPHSELSKGILHWYQILGSQHAKGESKPGSHTFCQNAEGHLNILVVYKVSRRGGTIAD